MKRRVKCEQCQLVIIQGIPCHETGCPSSWIDPLTDEGYPVDCWECGCDFIPDEKPWKGMKCVSCIEE